MKSENTSHQLKSLISLTFGMKNTIKNYRYASPGSQLILDKWKVDFNTYMASGLSYVVMEVDGSGSGGNINF